ncbi:MAG: ABC transporter permease [Candidatus Eisenbacteria sp.]|nr:ABC transporter permease [Candidatus Eisenbacteria bacterium]
MPRREQTAAQGRRHLALFLLAPVWAPFFLLAQAIGLCGDGLIQLWEAHLGHRSYHGSRLRWLMGVPGLVVFPTLIGLLGLGALVVGLGRSILRLLRWHTGAPAAAFGLGLVGILLLPIWLPLALVIWLLRWVVWRLLVPEFSRQLDSSGATSDAHLVTFIGLRYLFGRRETALHSATSYYAAAGIALGVCALIVVLAVMSGFDREVKSRIVGTNAHVILLRYGTQGLAQCDSLAQLVAGHPDVVAVAPFVYGKAMLSAGTAAEGAIVKGIDWKKAIAVTALSRYVGTPERPPRLARSGDGLPGMILGRHIADNLGLLPGDDFLLVSPAEARRTPLGFVPRMRRFRLEGIFNSGMYEFDASMAFIDLAEGQSFFGLGDRVTGLEVRIVDMNEAPRVGQEIVELVGGFPYRANNWIDLNENLFSWMRTEKRAMFVILIMIILVAGFNIASSLIMLVTDKRREIGILKSMGTTSMGILRIFVLEGWVMAFGGTALGAVVGLGLCHLLERYEFIRLPEDIYFIDTLPVRVEWSDVGLIVVSVLVIAALSTLYPAWKAARMDPIEAIHAE